jgi:hypothetical protein
MATIKKLKKEKDGNVPQTQITLAERKLGVLNPVFLLIFM